MRYSKPRPSMLLFVLTLACLLGIGGYFFFWAAKDIPSPVAPPLLLNNASNALVANASLGLPANGSVPAQTIEPSIVPENGTTMSERLATGSFSPLGATANMTAANATNTLNATLPIKAENASGSSLAPLHIAPQSGHISATSSTNTGKNSSNMTGLEALSLPSEPVYTVIPDVSLRETFTSAPALPVPSAAALQRRYGSKVPSLWGEKMPGIISHLSQRQNSTRLGDAPVVALTLDACGGRKGQSCDESLLDFLEENAIPATIFVTESWMRNNALCLDRLNSNPLYEIANHGKRHKPASVDGQSVYDIAGTQNIRELYDEVESTAQIIEELTGRRPLWFRAGTAYYDNIAVAVIRELHHNIAGYSITVDQGATLSAKRVAANVLKAQDGDILLAHLNHPEKGSGQGLRDSLPTLLKKGYQFIRLSDVRYSVN